MRFHAMDIPAADDINVLLTKALQLRSAATATALPHYRAKLLKAARNLEAKASEIEDASAPMLQSQP